MRRRRVWVRRISRAIATIAIGGLLGFLVPTVARDLSAQPEAEGVVAESLVARRFIDAFVVDDQAKLTSMGVTAEVLARATKFKTDYARVDPPVHLGAYSAGNFRFDAYAAHVLLPNGTEDLLSWRVISSGGRATLVLPPIPIQP